MGPFVIPAFRGTKQEQKWVKALLQQLPNCHYYFQQLHYSIQDWLPYYWQGYQQQTGYSYILEPLEPLDQVLQNFAPDYRNNKLKRAQESVRIVHDLSPKQCYQLNLKSFERQGLAFPFSEAFFLQYDQVLTKQQSRRLFFAGICS